jgi:hypothetical protein
MISDGISTAFPQGVKRHFAFLIFVGMVTSTLQCATLERLSMADMIGKSTAIVRAKVVGTSVATSGPVIYTHYQLLVSERYKGPAQSTVDLAVPGGAARGVQQVFSGAPQLQAGEEYVFFLYTGKSGLTQVIGLTQGLFAVSGTAAKDPALTRAGSHEMMLDHSSGRQVRDETLNMTLGALKSQIATALGAASGQPQGGK